MVKNLLCILLLALSSCEVVYAAPYYASPTGSGSTCSDASPCTVAGGISKMSAGDTLWLKNGTYTGSTSAVTSVKTGLSATQRTVIRAQNVGQAIIDGNYTVLPLDISGNYIEVDGIHFKRASNYNFNIVGSYHYIHNCGFEDGMSAANTGEHAIVCITDGAYVLIEDCWVWGRGRYGIYTGSNASGTNHVIFRRVVVRLDSAPSGWVHAGMRFYKGNTNVAQNSIVLDSVANGGSEGPSAFTMGGGSSTTEPYHTWDSVIALNNSGGSGFRGFKTEDVTTLNTVRNSIVWGNDGPGVDNAGDSGTGTFALSKMTIGKNDTNELTNAGSLTWTLGSSLVVPYSGSTAFSGIGTTTNTYYYLNGGSRGQSIGTALSLANYNASLKYLPRIESGSTLATAGAGATLVYQVGVTGAYYGQTDWDTVTSTPLWPFANEQMWGAKMAAYTASGPGGNRGFAALATTSTAPLTDYIWNQLGASPAIVNAQGIYSVAPAPVETIWTGPVVIRASGKFSVK